MSQGVDQFTTGEWFAQETVRPGQQRFGRKLRQRETRHHHSQQVRMQLLETRHQRGAGHRPGELVVGDEDVRRVGGKDWQRVFRVGKCVVECELLRAPQGAAPK